MNRKSQIATNAAKKRKKSCQVIRQDDGNLTPTSNIKIDSSQLPPAYQKLAAKLLKEG